MTTYKYVRYGEFYRIVNEYDTYYMILDEDYDEVPLSKTPNDVVETRTYLPEGTVVVYHNQICVISDVDINDFDTPYLIDFGHTDQWCEFDEVKEINY